MSDLTLNEPVTEFGRDMQSAFHAETAQAIALARVEIDMQIATARAFPRSSHVVQKRMLDMVSLDEEAAKECMYALPIESGDETRGKGKDNRQSKAITGPSIRFAEALKQAYGNNSAGSRITEVNRKEQYVEAEGVFLDLETNTRTTFRTRRSIRARSGRTYSERMIVTTGNAACAIAMRESVLRGVPRPLWRAAYQKVEEIIKGDIKTLSERREKAVRSFANFGVSAERVFARMEIEGIEDIGLDDLPELFALYQSIKSGEATVEELFPEKSEAAAGAVQDPLKDEPIRGKSAAETRKKMEDPQKSTVSRETIDAEGAGKGTSGGGNFMGGNAMMTAEEVAQHARAAPKSTRTPADRGPDLLDTAQDQQKQPEKAQQLPTVTDAAPKDQPVPRSFEATAEGTGAAADPAQDAAPVANQETLIPITPEELEAAFAAGKKAYWRGMPKKAIPEEYRKAGKEPYANRWVQGYEDGKREDTS